MHDIISGDLRTHRDRPKPRPKDHRPRGGRVIARGGGIVVRESSLRPGYRQGV